MWHTEIGLNLRALEKIVARYEESQDKVRIKLQFQGTYEEQLKKYEEASGDPASLPDIVSPDDTVRIGGIASCQRLWPVLGSSASDLLRSMRT